MKNILTIMRKEFARFFKDKRMVLTTLFLPGILIYVMYSFMGSFMEDMTSVDQNYKFKTYVVNMPTALETVFDEVLEVQDNADLSADQIKEKVSAGEADLYLIFPENFLELIINYDSLSGAPAPNVEIYYNSVENNSYTAYSVVAGILNEFESGLANKFDINAGDAKFDLAEEKDSIGKIFAMIMPMLMLMMLFSGCMAVAPEAIAGEKDRGTIATLLVTPIKRSQLAVGKILSLSCVAMLSGISSFIGIIFSLPKMMGGMIDGGAAMIYGVADYFMIFGIVISTVLILVSLIAILSAFSKSVKEASVLVMPLMIVVMLIGLFSMFSSGSSAFWQFLIPIYNSAVSITAVMSFAANPLNIALCIVSNFVYVCGLVFLLTVMFKSEKIMFNK